MNPAALVIIPTYNEPLDVLERTIVGALALVVLPLMPGEVSFRSEAFCALT